MKRKTKLDPLRPQRVAKAKKQLHRHCQAKVPKHKRRKFGPPKRDDPCAAEQTAYDNAITEAAEKWVDWQDAMSEEQAAHNNYENAFAGALIAAMQLDACRNPQP